MAAATPTVQASPTPSNWSLQSTPSVQLPPQRLTMENIKRFVGRIVAIQDSMNAFFSKAEFLVGERPYLKDKVRFAKILKTDENYHLYLLRLNQNVPSHRLSREALENYHLMVRQADLGEEFTIEILIADKKAFLD